MSKISNRLIENWAFVVPLLLLITLLVLPWLTGDMIDNEEYHSFLHVDQDTIADTWLSVARNSEQHAPFYFMMLFVWVKLIGPTLFSLRVLSLFCGVIAVALGYRFARDLLSRRIAFWVAFGLSTCAYLFIYMHEVRMYSFMVVLTFMLYWVYWRIMLRNKQHILNFFWLYLCAVMTIYTHYFGIFPLMAVGIYHILSFRKSEKRWWYVVAVMVMAGISFIPWLSVFIDGITTRASLADTALTLPEVVWALLTIYTNQFIPFVALYLLAIVVIFRRKKSSDWKRYLLIITVVAFLIPVIADQITPLLVARRMRYSLVLLPSIMILFGIGLDQLFRWNKILPFVALMIWCISGFSFVSSDLMLVYSNRHTKNIEVFPSIPLVIDYLDKTQFLPEPEPLFSISEPLTFPAGTIVAYYSRFIDRTYFHILEATVETGVNETGIDQLDVMVDFESEPAFWLAHHPDFDLESNVAYRTVLTKQHKSCMRITLDEQTVLNYFVQSDVACELFDFVQQVAYENDAVYLKSFYYEFTDSELTVYSLWNRQDTSDSFPYALSFQIFNISGEKVFQQDFIAPFEPIDIKSFDLSHIENGRYSVTLTLYDPNSGDVNMGRTDANSDWSRNVVLGEFLFE